MSQSVAKLAVANQALQLIGSYNAITDFGTGSADTSPEAVAVGNAYDTARQAFLVDNPWTFARTRTLPIAITAPTTTPSAWLTNTVYAAGAYVLQNSINYVCLLPHTSGVFATDLAAGKWTAAADALTVTMDNISVVYTIPTNFLALYQVSQSSIFQVEFTPCNAVLTKCLLSDTANLGIVYIFDNDDPSTYFAKAKKAFIKLLASEITIYLSSATKTRLQLLTEYEEVDLPQAQAKDSQQGTPLQPDQYEWERMRFIGTGPIFPPNPGAQTWITVWAY